MRQNSYDAIAASFREQIDSPDPAVRSATIKLADAIAKDLRTLDSGFDSDGFLAKVGHPDSLQTYVFEVTVLTDNVDHAWKVLQERLGHDEDYGFEYRIPEWLLQLHPKQEDDPPVSRLTEEAQHTILKDVEEELRLIRLDVGDLTKEDKNQGKSIILWNDLARLRDQIRPLVKEEGTHSLALALLNNIANVASDLLRVFAFSRDEAREAVKKFFAS